MFKYLFSCLIFWWNYISVGTLATTLSSLANADDISTNFAYMDDVYNDISFFSI